MPVARPHPGLFLTPQLVTNLVKHTQPALVPALPFIRFLPRAPDFILLPSDHLASNPADRLARRPRMARTGGLAMLAMISGSHALSFERKRWKKWCVAWMMKKKPNRIDL